MLKSNQVKSEVYYLNWRKSRAIEEGPRLVEQSVLFVEQGDTKDKPENFKWHREFNKEFDKLYLFINNPLSAQNPDEFKTQVQIKKSDTLIDLKHQISQLINLPISDMVLKKKAQGAELKNLQAKLIEFNLMDGDLIRVEQGKPHEDGTHSVTVHRVVLSQQQDYEEVLFDKKFISKFKIDPYITVAQFKQIVVDHYNQENEQSLTVEQVKIRIPKVDDLGEVPLSTEVMDNLDLFDGKEIYF